MPEYTNYFFSREILEMIFDKLAPPLECAMGRRTGGEGPNDPHMDIVAVSRVCRSWRHRALGYSAIWSSITITGPAACNPCPRAGDEPWWIWAHMLMARSREAPLFVCLDLKFVGEGCHCEAIRECLPRIKRLCIHGSELSKNPILDVLKANTAPKLETLSLDLTSTNRLVTCGFQPGELFCNSAPRLRQLVVKPGIAVLSSVHLSGLTHYTVLHRGNEGTPPTRNRPYDLHARLSLMTSRLEVLEIESDTHTRLDWGERQEIRFQRLRDVVIKDSLQNCKQILAKMVVPAGCTIKFVVLQDYSVVDASETIRIRRNGYASNGQRVRINTTEEGQVVSRTRV